MLDSVIVEPGGAHRASIIWLHGLGADGHDFEPVVPELGLPAAAGVRCIFPHAPVRPVTINGGIPMRAWYDIRHLGPDGSEDEAGIQASQAEVEALIAGEKEAGVPASRIVLAGFSQGGAIALHTGLRHAEPLAGIVGLSTYLPLRDRLSIDAVDINREVPIFMAHGDLDPMLPRQLGEFSRDLLRQAGHSVQWHSYPMQHQVCLEELRELGGWLRERLA